MDTRLHQQQRRRQQIGHSRRNQSTSTEDTDPFPEVLSWAALIDVQTTLRSPQTIPSDVLSKVEDPYTSSFELTNTEPETETDSEDESGLDEDDMSILSSLFDPTTLHVGFDLTCLEGLDDELLLCPHDAFAAICWADAVRVRDGPTTPTKPPSSASPLSPPSYEDALLSLSRGKPKPRPSPLNPSSRSRQAHVISRFPDTSDGSDSDSDDTRTFTEGQSPTSTTTAVSGRMHMNISHSAPTIPNDSGLNSDEYLDSSPTTPLYAALPKGKTLFFEEYNTSFMLLEPHFPLADPKDSVGYFPIPSNTAKPRSKANCIASFCANLPSRLGKSS